MEEWTDFVIADVGAAAAFAGLLVACVPSLIGGGLLIAGDGAGLYWVAVGIILSFLATLQNGWVLLIEILR